MLCKERKTLAVEVTEECFVSAATRKMKTYLKIKIELQIITFVSKIIFIGLTVAEICYHLKTTLKDVKFCLLNSQGKTQQLS